jgi:hypothetical protein
VRRIVLFLSVVGVLFSISCGSGSSSSSSTTTGPTSKIAKRAFVSNQATNVIEIVDAAKDSLPTNTTTGAAFTISAGFSPTLMLETQDKKETIVYGSSSNTLGVINNSTETVSASVNLSNPTESFVISNDNRFLFIAERNTIPTGAARAGAVEIFDLNNLSAGSTFVAVAGARRVVLSHNGSTLLVFSDDSTPIVSSTPNNTKVFFINTASTASGATAVPGFDNPVFAVFTSDDSTAYVLNCGAECGGTTASVSAVSVSLQAITATTPALPAARIGLLNGTTLYVAGTTLGSGQLSAVNVSSMTQIGSSVSIPDGVHDRIALGSNGKLFVGARACSNTTQGCLAIYDTAANTVVIHGPYGSGFGTTLPGDITALEPIPGRNVVYVCEGGALRIYDTTTNTLQTTQITIAGKDVDVKEVF